MKRKRFLLVVLTTLFLFIFSLNSAAYKEDFIYTEGTNFMMNDETFYFAGANAYDLFTRGDGWIGRSEQSREEIITYFMDQEQIDDIMSKAAKDGIRVIRTWGFSHEEWHGFEPYEGEYNRAQFILFDYILKSAEEHGIKIIVVLENYWEDYGGIDERLDREGLPSGDHDSRRAFFTDEGCKEQYKNYVEHFVTRTNTFTDVPYKDDPTIFSWELMNEPRYQSSDYDDEENSSGETLRAWIDEMGTFIKDLDPNHMVSAGIEGHESRYGFGGNEGNPFIYIHQSPVLDFATAHPYPDEPWAGLSPEENAELVRQWINDAHNEVGKPIVIEEFNVHDDKEGYWSKMFDVIEELDAAGSCFWNYETRSGGSQFDMFHGDSVMENVFVPHAERMIEKSGIDSGGSGDDEEVISGDLNSDQLLDSLDITMMRRYLLEPGSIDINNDAADMNNDDYIDSIDFTLLRRELLS